jgi:two-component system, cell cycle sensor histidine kinase and response regulator CckA
MALNPRILVMDDEAALLRILKLIFPVSGFEIETALDGEEAIKLYQKAREEKHPFAAAILDLNVPAGLMGGAAAARGIKKIDPQAKLIATSGDSFDEVMQNYKNYDFCATAVKPYEIEEIKKLLKEVIDGK